MPFGQFARREIAHGNFFGRKIETNKLQVNSNFAIQTECEHSETVRVRQIEANGLLGFLYIERRFS